VDVMGWGDGRDTRNIGIYSLIILVLFLFANLFINVMLTSNYYSSRIEIVDISIGEFQFVKDVDGKIWGWDAFTIYDALGVNQEITWKTETKRRLEFKDIEIGKTYDVTYFKTYGFLPIIGYIMSKIERNSPFNTIKWAVEV